MATGTFTHNALYTKTLKERIKTHKKNYLNSTRAMLLVKERLPLTYLSICPVGLVWSARCHRYSYGGLR